MFRQTFIFILIIFTLISCTTVQRNKKLSYQTKTDWSGLTGPRFIEGMLEVHIRNIKVLKGDSLAEYNKSNKIPVEQKPTLLLWSPQIRSFPNQQNVQNIMIKPHPDFIAQDSVNGNSILFWDLSDELSTNDSIIVSRRFSYVTYDYRPLIQVKDLKIGPDFFKDSTLIRYIQSEPFLEQSAAILVLADSLSAQHNNALDIMRSLHQFVNQNMTYVYPPEERGALAAIKNMSGDCGQYSALFIALSRALGVPARQQSGFNFSAERISYHVWSEIYLPKSGWIPVDATREDGFGFLDNKRLIASAGMNIDLPNAPKWANAENSEVDQGKADFMQLVTIVKSGFEADISTKRTILQDVLLK